MKNVVIIVLTVIFLMGCSGQFSLPVSDVVKLHRAAESGNLDLVKQLVEAGVDKNDKVGEWQDTALHRAAIYHHKDVAIYLINSEIDVNIMDRYGNTVLDDAIGWGDQLIIELLRERGAKTREELEASTEQ
jgi:ankyrin repeat protein